MSGLPASPLPAGTRAAEADEASARFPSLAPAGMAATPKAFAGMAA